VSFSTGMYMVFLVLKRVCARDFSACHQLTLDFASLRRVAELELTSAQERWLVLCQVLLKRRQSRPLDMVLFWTATGSTACEGPRLPCTYLEVEFRAVKIENSGRSVVAVVDHAAWALDTDLVFVYVHTPYTHKHTLARMMISCGTLRDDVISLRNAAGRQVGTDRETRGYSKQMFRVNSSAIGFESPYQCQSRAPVSAETGELLNMT
jgi:hypothetical protein